MSSWDQSTIIITPSRGMMHISVTMSLLSLLLPVNNIHSRAATIGMEVGEAYSSMIDKILVDKELARFRYVCTLEDDMIVPPGGLIKLHKDIVKGYDIVGALYWTKDEINSYPLVYGRPELGFEDTMPVEPNPGGGLQEVNCVGMGFTLFRKSLFEDERFARPFFQTSQTVSDDGMHCDTTTQDMFFQMQARKFGYKIAVDLDVKCGHLNTATGKVYGAETPYIQRLSGGGRAIQEREAKAVHVGEASGDRKEVDQEVRKQAQAQEKEGSETA